MKHLLRHARTQPEGNVAGVGAVWVESVGYRTDSRHGVHDAEKTGVASRSSAIANFAHAR